MEDVFTYAVSDDAGATWRVVTAHQTRAEVHAHIGMLATAVADQPLSLTFTSGKDGTVTAANGPMRWEWRPMDPPAVRNPLAGRDAERNHHG